MLAVLAIPVAFRRATGDAAHLAYGAGNHLLTVIG